MSVGMRLFESKHMWSVLRHLYNTGVCTRMEMYTAVANNDRMPEKFAVLENEGLIRQYMERNSRAIKMELTDKGKEVVERLIDVDKMMRED